MHIAQPLQKKLHYVLYAQTLLKKPNVYAPDPSIQKKNQALNRRIPSLFGDGMVAYGRMGWSVLTVTCYKGRSIQRTKEDRGYVSFHDPWDTLVDSS